MKQRLELAEGWNGGQWLVGNENAKFENGEVLLLNIGGFHTRGVVVKIHGSDHDHDHVYQWENTDVTMEVTTVIGDLRVSLREYIKQHAKKAIYIVHRTQRKGGPKNGD